MLNRSLRCFYMLQTYKNDRNNKENHKKDKENYGNDKENLVIIFSVLFLFILVTAFFATGDTSGILVTVNNTAPTIEDVDSKSAEDPGYCTTTSIGPVIFNVSDHNGVSNINISSAYVNFSNGTTIVQATNCTNSSSGLAWMRINCTGASFDYHYSSGTWVITVYVGDNSGSFVSANLQNMTYNKGSNVNATETINFGSVAANTNDNVITGDYYLYNCGNTILDTNLTASDILDDSGVNNLSATFFRVDDDVTPGGGDSGNNAELNLTTSTQEFIKYNNTGIAIYPNTGYNWQLWFFLNVPYVQASGTYNNGSFSWTVYEHT